MTQNNNVLEPTVDMGSIEKKSEEIKEQKETVQGSESIDPRDKTVGRKQKTGLKYKAVGEEGAGGQKEVSDKEADDFFAGHVSPVAKLVSDIREKTNLTNDQRQEPNPDLMDKEPEEPQHLPMRDPVSAIDAMTMAGTNRDVSHGADKKQESDMKEDLISPEAKESGLDEEGLSTDEAINKIEELPTREPESDLEKTPLVKEVQEEKIQEQKESLTFTIPAEATVSKGHYKFPEGFLWGTSTSAYQVEGGIKNDWSEWEVSDKRLAYLEKNDMEKETYVCGDAVDHYRLYKEDIDRAVSLNNNSIRIGLEWARIQPKQDTWDVTAINHYREVLDYAQEQGLKTIVTLWHWTNPLWISEEKGWVNKKTIEYFGEYVDFVIRELGGQVDFWITLNEPLMHVFGGYLKGYFPPGKHNPFLAEGVFWNLVRAHKLAYKKIHKHFPKARVSITALVNHIEPANNYNPIEFIFARAYHYFWNHRFLKKCRKYLDYIGLDYYFHDRIVWYPPFRKNKNKRINDKGWEIYPQGILAVLRYLAEFKKPIYIMENGLSDRDDQYRTSFIKDHLYFVHQAIEEGIDVRGYFHWSLLDNFEWAYGWTMCFGLYEVDRETMERVERPSAEVYKRICGENRVVIE